MLDVGTGVGSTALALAERGAVVAALDLTPAMLEKVREQAHARGLDFVVLSDHNTSAQVPRLAALKAETFVLYPRKPRPSFADHILNICLEEGFIPRSQVLAQDYQTAISLVSVGVGIGIVMVYSASAVRATCSSRARNTMR